MEVKGTFTFSSLACFSPLNDVGIHQVGIQELGYLVVFLPE